MKAGFIGLGQQGAPMARMIARSGFALSVWDKSPAAVAAFDESGVRLCASAAEVARACEVLGVCVRTDDDLRALLDGDALLKDLGAGSVLLIHSTVMPELCVEIAEQGRALGVQVLDAGVSSSGEGALGGKLAVFVGGEAAALERVRPVLETYGNPIGHLGPVGSGMRAKLVNNLTVIANMGLVAAALDLGETLGLDRTALREVMLGGSATSYALAVAPGILGPGRDFSLVTKDLHHGLAIAPEGHAGREALKQAAETLLAYVNRA